jgi:ATP-dependent RNA helicase DHX37/DHR1
LVRPIEEVVLALKSMKISKIGDFPFPTPPDRNQVDAAIKLLASIGCIEISQGNIQADDGVITKLGEAVSKLPVSVRYGKMLIAASDANILDYGIALVAILSESCPFVQHRLDIADSDDSSSTTDDFDTSDKLHDNKKAALISGKVRWANKGGDLISSLLAFGAYSYASRDSKGNEAPGVQFCQENGLNPVIMQRICKMHNHLSKLIKNKLANVDTSPEKASYHLLKPPSRRDKHLLQQVGIFANDYKFKLFDLIFCLYFAIIGYSVWLT